MFVLTGSLRGGSLGRHGSLGGRDEAGGSGSKYPIFTDAGPKNHEGHGFEG